ncbi:ShlB/FhaC/HecB family hemolysin secretion/activation protein [Komarekiella delphini-convector]|uniref:ShlB/FhaC/HecB family hemolysin secretion/activation protein n=1 Tax=Komarekiella delphini-convector TaxID=3050158 RepID=UPI0032AF6B53
MIDKSPKNSTFSWLNLSLLILLFVTTTRPLHAQSIDTAQLPNLPPPQDIQPHTPTPQPSPELPQPLPPPPELLEPSQLTPTPEELIPSKPIGVVTVKRFEIIGSTIFRQEELAKSVSDFLNRPLTLDDLKQARSRITDLYINKGYITSGAYIPPQEIQFGVVRIQIVENRLQDIQIIGLRRLSLSYIRDRLKAGTTGIFNQKLLLEALQLLQLDPLIERVYADLSPGDRLNSPVLTVNIEEVNTFNAQITLDNGRSPSVGSFRRRLQVTEANLLGLGDSLGLGYTNTDGSNSFDVDYTLPINPQDGTISFNYGTTSSDVIERPFNALDIQSDSRYYELTYRQPLIKTPRQELALGLTASRRESEISSLLFQEEFGLPPNELSPGADEQGRTRVSALRFFQEWTSRNNRQVLAVRSQFSLGLGAFDATINSDRPDSRFFSWQGQAQLVRLLSPETIALVRLNTQLATTTLVPFEQFSVSGQESVRGYRQDFLLADNGVFASAEIQVPILRASGTLQVIPFADSGMGGILVQKIPTRILWLL